MSSISVIMPTFKQERFIQRALDSLLVQTRADWELWIIDDGSPDETAAAVTPYLRDPRIHFHRLERNEGMGVALNAGLDRSTSDLIAYLPSDDLYFQEHLASLAKCLQENASAVAAFSGVRFNYNRQSTGQIDDYPLQLVQVMHRRTAERWMERGELTTDDLERMFWARLRAQGGFLATHQVTSEWVSHPAQRHKLLREPEGGINLYRQYTGSRQPLRFHTSVGNYIDEAEHYRRFRQRPDTPPAADRLKIVLVGELAYNPERILALEELGHKLYGLWMHKPYWYNTVGPVPFGHVEDIPSENWQESLRHIQPDLIYALLNWQAVPFAHEVLTANTGIPFIWHFKEGPFICLEKGSWDELVDLQRLSDGQIYCSPEMRDWYAMAVPGSVSGGNPYVLDGDLPKKEWFAGERSPRLSEQDGELHTVVPGRPIGLHPETVAELARSRVHLHFYGDFTHGQWRQWIDKTQRLAAGYIHLHGHVHQESWVREFSQYDAGWLHYFRSKNGGDLRRANWDDLNYPARISTLMAAGLPMLQRENSGAVVASQNLVRSLNAGFFFAEMGELAELLHDRERLEAVRENVWRQREKFAFDVHAPALISYFRQVIEAHAKKPRDKPR
jgi:glycosyltransferase involved in cell wall biosynthesis